MTSSTRQRRRTCEGHYFNDFVEQEDNDNDQITQLQINTPFQPAERMADSL